MIWLDDFAFNHNRLMISFSVNHHFELHLCITKHVVNDMGVVWAQFCMFFEEIFRRVILICRAAQSMSPSGTRQIAQLRLLCHLQVCGTLNCWNTFCGIRTWITLFKRCNCVSGTIGIRLRQWIRKWRFDGNLHLICDGIKPCEMFLWPFSSSLISCVAALTSFFTSWIWFSLFRTLPTIENEHAVEIKTVKTTKHVKNFIFLASCKQRDYCIDFCCLIKSLKADW